MTFARGSDRQNEYYAATACEYQAAHVVAGDEHFIALEYVVALAQMLNCKSVLDIGAGTGRALAFILGRLPDVRAVGVEPVRRLAEIGVASGLDIIVGSGDRLPFRNGEFDLVVATGVMHHVADPPEVLAEMIRVCSKLLAISDSNRFGQGTQIARALKLGLHRAGLWPILERIRTRGKGYMESDGDGIFYSYSIFDSRRQVAVWADRTFVIPTSKSRIGLLGTTAEAGHGLLVGVREPTNGLWARF